jgi:hypothetical protein
MLLDGYQETLHLTIIEIALLLLLVDLLLDLIRLAVVDALQLEDLLLERVVVMLVVHLNVGDLGVVHRLQVRLDMVILLLMHLLIL